MRLAIPLFESEVAPRFCRAREVLVVDLDGDGPDTRRRHSFENDAWAERLRRLSELGVEILLCGGINRHYLPLASSLEIEVICGLRGEVEELIDAFRSNTLSAPDNIAPDVVRACDIESARRGRRSKHGQGPGRDQEVNDA